MIASRASTWRSRSGVSMGGMLHHLDRASAALCESCVRVRPVWPVASAQRNARSSNSLAFDGAGGGGRTLTTRRSRDFESRASASFTTPARPGEPLKYTARLQPAIESTIGTDTRFRSVYALNPSTPYLWKFTWGTGTEVRVSVKEDGIDGPKRIGIRVGARRDLSQRLDREPPSPDITRKRLRRLR